MKGESNVRQSRLWKEFPMPTERKWYVIWFPSVTPKVKYNRRFADKLFKCDEDCKIWIPSYFSKDKNTILLEPLFSGYVFIYCMLNKGITEFFKRNYRAQFLSGETGPIPLTKKEVERVEEVEKSYTLNKIKVKTKFCEGECVEVTEGPFIGLKGSINYIKDGNAFVSITLFGRAIDMPIHFSILKKV